MHRWVAILKALRTALTDHERGRRAIWCTQAIRCQHLHRSGGVHGAAGHRPTELVVVHGRDLQLVQGPDCGRDSAREQVVFDLEKAHFGQIGNARTDRSRQLVIVQVHLSEIGQCVEFFRDGSLEEIEIQIDLLEGSDFAQLAGDGPR